MNKRGHFVVRLCAMSVLGVGLAGCMVESPDETAGAQADRLTASAGDDVTIRAGESVQLQAIAGGGDGAYTFRWSPADGLSDASVANPIATPDETTTYTVTVQLSVFGPLTASAGADVVVDSSSSGQVVEAAGTIQVTDENGDPIDVPLIVVSTPGSSGPEWIQFQDESTLGDTATPIASWTWTQGGEGFLGEEPDPVTDFGADAPAPGPAFSTDASPRVLFNQGERIVRLQVQDDLGPNFTNYTEVVIQVNPVP